MYIADDSVLVPCLPFVLGLLPKLQLCAVCFQLVIVSSLHLHLLFTAYATTDASATLTGCSGTFPLLAWWTTPFCNHVEALYVLL